MKLLGNVNDPGTDMSLSVWGEWIEIMRLFLKMTMILCLSPFGESGLKSLLIAFCIRQAKVSLRLGRVD